MGWLEDQGYAIMTMWIEMKRHFEARSLEWFVALSLWAWGAYVILHPGMFQSQPNFLGLLRLANQEIWGFAALLFGGTRVVALFINGRWGVTPVIRVATSFTSILVWFWVCVGLYKSGIPQTGLVIYPGLVLADMFSASRAAADAYEAEAMRRLQKLSEGPNVTSIHRG